MTGARARALIAGAVLTFSLAGAFQHTTPSQPKQQQPEACYQVLPHNDYRQPGDFNRWTASLPPFTNLEFDGGFWLADGVPVGYGLAEDSAIWTCR